MQCGHARPDAGYYPLPLCLPARTATMSLVYYCLHYRNHCHMLQWIRAVYFLSVGTIVFFIFIVYWLDPNIVSPLSRSVLCCFFFSFFLLDKYCDDCTSYDYWSSRLWIKIEVTQNSMHTPTVHVLLPRCSAVHNWICQICTAVDLILVININATHVVQQYYLRHTYMLIVWSHTTSKYRSVL